MNRGWADALRRRAHGFALAGLLFVGLPSGNAAPPITALAFSPDSRTLVSAGPRRITLHTLASSDPPQHLETDLPKVSALAFLPRHSGPWLAVAGGTPGVSGATLLFSPEDGREQARLPHPGDTDAAVAIDPAGTRMAIVGDGPVRLYALDNGTPRAIGTLAGHVGRVLGAAFSPDGAQLVTVGRDRSVKVWSVATTTLVRSFNHHTEAVHAVAFRPPSDGVTAPSACATGGDDRTVRIWQPGIGRMVRIIRGHEGSILALTYSADGRALFTAGSEGRIRHIDADSDSILGTWSASTDWIYALAASPDGRLLATGDWNGTVTLWTPAGVEIRRFDPEPP